MRFYGNRRKEWAGYVVILITVVLAALTRNRPRYRSTADGKGGAPVYTSSDRTASPYATRRLQPESVDRYRSRRLLLLLLPLFALLLAAIIGLTLLSQRRDPNVGGASGGVPSANAAIEVNPQAANDSVTVARVVAPQGGWVALYRTDANGQPNFNAPVGRAQVQAGENTDIQVPLEQPVGGDEALAAVLHADAGTSGTFEYPNGPDAPLTVDGSTVATMFAVQNSAAAAAGSGTGGLAAATSPPSSQPTTEPAGAASAQPQPATVTPVQATGVATSRAAGAAATGTAPASNATSSPQAGVAVAGSTATIAAITATADVATTSTDTAASTAIPVAEADTATDSTTTSVAGSDTTPETTATSVAGAAIVATGTPDAAEATASPQATAEATPETAAAATATARPAATTGQNSVDVGVGAAAISAAAQPFANNTVMLDTVVAPQAGWVAIYRRNPDGEPDFGEVLGAAQVQAGETNDLQIALNDTVNRNDELVAVLHTDAGMTGTLEYPAGPDVPVAAAGSLVAADLTLSSDAAAAATGVSSAAEQATNAATPQATVDAAAATTATSEATALPTATSVAVAPPTAIVAATAAPQSVPTATAVTEQAGTPSTQSTATAEAPPQATSTAEATAEAQPQATASSGGTAAASDQGEVPQSIVTSNQQITGNTVTLDLVVASQDGWVTLHRVNDAGEAIPDAVVGVAPLKVGTSRNVEVPLDAALANGERVVPLLHLDAGTVGTFEFPAGPDTPIVEEYATVTLTVNTQTPEQLPNSGARSHVWTMFAAAFLLVAVGTAMRRQLLR
jgi:hypothetical protein